jgi:hypothetical protein
MTNKLLIIAGIVCLLTVGLYFSPITFNVRLNYLTDTKKFDQAYKLIEEDEDLKKDLAAYNAAKLKVLCLDKSSPISEVFSVLNLLDHTISVSWKNDLKKNYASLIVNKLKKYSSFEISNGLVQLTTKNSRSWYNSILFKALKKTALKEQSVSAWNNCILFCPKMAEIERLTIKRRKLYFDTVALKRSNLSIESIVAQNPCYIPILTKMDRVYNRAFSINELYNPEFPKSNFLSRRYIVGDFNSTDAKGNCRGSFDLFAKNHKLNEFQDFIKDLKKDQVNVRDTSSLIKWYKSLSAEKKHMHFDAFWMWRNYYDKVEKFRTVPLKRDPVITIGGADYCIGQRLCLCEIQNDTIKMVAQFVTSSRNVKLYHGPLIDYDLQPRYYAPKCVITSRFWDQRLPYDSLDIKRDAIMKGGSKLVVRYKRKVELPNFMNMKPDKNYLGSQVFVNGIHEFAVGGRAPGFYMGTPISLGCVRLHSYPSRFLRWWAPNKARFFISYQYKNYIQKYIDPNKVKDSSSLNL